jgi:hypothetical protein
MKRFAIARLDNTLYRDGDTDLRDLAAQGSA